MTNVLKGIFFLTLRTTYFYPLTYNRNLLPGTIFFVTEKLNTLRQICTNTVLNTSLSSMLSPWLYRRNESACSSEPFMTQIRLLL